MDDLTRTFWRQQTSMAVTVTSVAIIVSMGLDWLSNSDTTSAEVRHSLMMSFLIPAVVAPLALFYVIRQNLRNLHLHLKVQHLANRDDLTSLANRRFLTQLVTARLADTDRAPTGLILADIDWFKRVNDTFGHEAGDEVLCHIARTLEHAVPAGAVVARLGGEEFTIVCDVADLDQLSHVAEALRRAIESTRLLYRGEAIRVTISLGLTLFQPDDTVSSLLTRADRALYDAKHLGRNQAALAA
ncbi:GGDEF domain-containing protein [Hyphomonas johnsonii]|nr:GGDEF domain-containing protein [Hyphomonas johnsonii]